MFYEARPAEGVSPQREGGKAGPMPTCTKHKDVVGRLLGQFQHLCWRPNEARRREAATS